MELKYHSYATHIRVSMKNKRWISDSVQSSLPNSEFGVDIVSYIEMEAIVAYNVSGTDGFIWIPKGTMCRNCLTFQ